MVIGETKKLMSDNYKHNSLYSFAESYVDLTRGILNENATDVYSEPTRAFMMKNTNEALKRFFVEESYDPTNMSADEIDDHIMTMEAQYDNDRAALLENVHGAYMNPMIGISIPMHKFILMNMVFDKGSIPKFVARAPKFTISMEYRILIDTEGNELDMFRDQNLMTDAIEKTAAETEFELPTLPFLDDNEIVHTYLGGLAGADHLSIETRVSAFKVEDQYFEVGDILPDEETGYIEPNGEVATEAGVHPVWVRCNYPFAPAYGDVERSLMAPISYEYKVQEDGDVKITKVTDFISGTMQNDRLNVQVMKGNISGLRVTSRLDTSSARLTTCSVRWKEKTDIVEIPNAIPIDVTISPEETKDIASLYNVNQVTKLMSMIKTVLGNYKDDLIRRKLDYSYKTMDVRSKTYAQFDFAPREGFHGDHVEWRRNTFFDFFDQQMTKLYQVLNDPDMTITVFGDPDLVRRITPTDYSYQTPSSIGPVQLDFTKTVVTSDSRVYNFIGSDKLRGNTEFIVILCPRGTDRIIYRIYDYQMYISNEIRNADNPALPNIHAFERWKFVEYQPVQGRINILHPTGLTDHYDYVQVKNV
jgi:hypothetical protein